MPVAANRARFGLSVTGVSAELRLLAFRGREALSAPFDFHLDVISPHHEFDPATLLGREACLTLYDAEPSHRHGILRAVELIGFEGRFIRYRFHLVPRLHWLTLRRGFKIFQQQSVPEIVRHLLMNAGLSVTDFRFELGRSYPPRDYCVQYDETDLQFMQRLLADEGIHYHFEHLPERHVLVLADQARSFQSLPDPVLPFRSEVRMPQDSVIYSFSDRRAKVSEVFEHNDYNPLKPNHDLRAQAESDSDSPLRIYTWPGAYQDTDRGASLAKDRLAALQRGRRQIRGASRVTRMWPGACFELQYHPRADFNREYLVLAVEHEGEQPQVLEEYQGAGACHYSNHFTLMPTEQDFRPEPVTKPRVPAQTAVVVGPPGAPMHTDAQGRIQVRFHWDQEDKHSCWLRVTQDWAGAFWGSQVLSRVGQEVLVEFVDGDPDRPIVTGCLYNGVNRPPELLPEHQSRTWLRSQGLAGGEGHEILVEDHAGEEKVGVRSAGDLELQARRDHRATYGGTCHHHIEGESRTTIGGAHHLQIQGDRREHVAGQDSLILGQNLHLKAGQDIRHQAGQELHLKASQRLMIEARESLHLKAGTGSIRIAPDGIWIDGPAVGFNTGQPVIGAASAAPRYPDAADLLARVSAGQPLQPAPMKEVVQPKPIASIYLDKTLEPLMREQLLTLAEAGQALGELCLRQPDGSCLKPDCHCVS